ncbi:uncharacterized protein METZ01_LOCUS142844 [marine metagenome]|uniref:Uncharacterized protein n=1 Tax=marine metagenome TaxID=408172 RepID=A0A381ZL63_9ZZZZ
MIKIHEPGKAEELNKRAKRDKKERSRKAIREKYTRDDRTYGVWEAIYKKGSMPETEHIVQHYTPK